MFAACTTAEQMGPVSCWIIILEISNITMIICRSTTGMSISVLIQDLIRMLRYTR